MLARGSLGNPWLFEQLLGRARRGARRAEEVLDELALGRSTAPRSTSARSARPATCASSIPGTSSGSAAPQALQDATCSAPTTLDAVRRALCCHARLAACACCESPPALALQRAASRLSDPSRRPAVMQKDVILTPEGLEKLKEEIEYLSTEKRREVAERIKEAREFGDISENSEYDDAKNEQAMLEARIATLEDKLRSATVIDASELVHRRRARRLAGPRQGRGDRQVADVHDRGLHRGQPGREQALQRVAGRARR